MIALFHIPRTGGSFLGFYIRECGLSEHFVPGIGHHCYCDIKDKVKDAVKIAFIRWPMDWYVSNYFYFARPDFKTEGGILKGWDDGLSGKDFLRRFPCFEDWLLWLLERDSYSGVVRRMLYEDDELQMDFIGRFHNLLDDFERFTSSDSLVMPSMSVHEYHEKWQQDNRKTNRSFHAPYMEYYTDELMKKVQSVDFLVYELILKRIKNI